MRIRPIVRFVLLSAASTALVVSDDGLTRAATAQTVCTVQTLGPAVANIPSVRVQPVFRLNGKAFPSPRAGVGVFTLWASESNALYSGPQLVLGHGHEQGVKVRVVPGVYDVYYSWVSGNLVPRNQGARVMRHVSLQSDTKLIIDVPMIRITGRKLHNRDEFNFEGVATMALRGLDGSGNVPLGEVQPPEFDRHIIPGSYDVEYSWQQGFNFPQNEHASVRTISLFNTVEDLALNVPSVIQSVEFLHNGNAFPASPYERGDLVLRRGEREEVRLGSSDEGGATIRVIPGTYDVYWQHRAGAAIVPINRDGLVRANVLANGTALIVDVPSVDVAGQFLLNGQTPPKSPFENARVSLATKGGDAATLGETQHGAFAVRVIPGIYDVIYQHLAGAVFLPWNKGATLARGWNVGEQPSRDFDILVGVLKGAFRLNGAPFPASQFESGNIYAVGPDNQEPVFLGQTDVGAFEARLLPGKYRGAYAHVAGAVIVPKNSFSTFGSTYELLPSADISAVLDVRAGPLEVTYQHNGTPLSEGGLDNAVIHLARGANYLRLPESALGGPILAMDGRFDLYYEYRAGSALPLNLFMPVGCWNLKR